MNDHALFDVALETLNEGWATQTIPSRVAASDYDREFGERICRLMFEKCGGEIEKYRRALHDFIDLSEEFVRLQMDLERTGHYLHSSFDEVREAVYDNPATMDGRYLNGLFLSEAFWINHTKMHAYFVEQFCAPQKETGTILEVPCGTGIFISEFMRRNSHWIATAIDLSASAVAFTECIVRLNGNARVAIRRQDIFEMPLDEHYDRVICGELLEHLEEPEKLLQTLGRLIAPDGKIFLTTAVWAASPDHIYLFKSAREAREMLLKYFDIESELVLNVRENQTPDQEQVPINYACVLRPKAGSTA